MQVRAVIDAHLLLHIDDLGPQATIMLREKFTRTNPKWTDSKRRGFYTGPTKQNPEGIQRFIRSYSMDEPWLLLPRGSLEMVRKLLAAEGLQIGEIVDRTVVHEPVRFKLQEKLRPYQKKAVDALVAAGCGTLKGPCGSGKTVAMLGAIAKIGQPTLVVVHSKPLMKQWIAMASRFLGVIPGTIGGGKATVIRSLTVAMQQTVYNRTDARWWRDFGCLAGDEIHHWAARTFQITANSCPGKFRIGCSADETRKDGLEFMIYETFGPVAAEIPREVVMQAGKLLPTRIEVVPTGFWCEEYAECVKVGVTPDWNAMLRELVQDRERNKIIMRHVQRVLSGTENRILILNDRVKACKAWVNWLRELGYNAGLMIGGDDNKDELGRTIDGLRTGKVRIGVGTSVADEGLDIPPLTHVFLTCPVHGHPKRMVQQFGRAARPHGDKEFGVAVYFWDRKLWPLERDDDTMEDRLKKERAFIKKLENICDALTVLE